MSMFSKSKMLNSAGGKTKNFIFHLVLIFGTLPLSRFKPTDKKKNVILLTYEYSNNRGSKAKKRRHDVGLCV